MLFDNIATKGQTDALPLLLGGKKRHKQVICVGKAMAVINNFD
ncbi:MAG: hypothetical protein ACI936_003655 [Paraglaciecola sp.]|jgi:hypothetical protein